MFTFQENVLYHPYLITGDICIFLCSRSVPLLLCVGIYLSYSAVNGFAAPNTQHVKWLRTRNPLLLIFLALT